MLAGFYLLRVHDQSIATYVAALLNGAVAVIAWAISVRTPAHSTGIEPAVPSSALATGAIRADDAAIYVAIGLSGASALGAQVVWTRLLSLTFGPSVYTFSVILAVFLTGLGIGSAVGAALAPIVASPAMHWPGASCSHRRNRLAAAIIFVALPNWPIDPALAPSPWFALQLDLVRCALVVLPAAVLWGASFRSDSPLSQGPGEDTARLVGRVYAANTLGAIIGAVGCGLLLIPFLGTRDAQRVLIAATAVASMLALLAPRQVTARGAAELTRAEAVASGGRSRVALLLTPIMAALLIVTVPELPGVLIAHGRKRGHMDRQEGIPVRW